MPFGGGVQQNVDLAKLAGGLFDGFLAEFLMSQVAID